MIRIRVRKNSLEVEGHAGYDEPGKDVVCAAVSGMTQLVAYTIERLGGSFEKRKGFLAIRWSSDACSEIVVRTLLDSLESMEREYPDHLRVEVI